MPIPAPIVALGLGAVSGALLGVGRITGGVICGVLAITLWVGWLIERR